MIANRLALYLAAPLFSGTEKTRNLALRDALLPYVDVYLPQEDGALLVELVQAGVPAEAAKREIFVRDLAAIDSCDILALIMDGRSIDEGGCFELGYAFSRGKVCVGIKNDPRMLLAIGDNPMIECALRAKFLSDEEFITWIQNAGWRAS
jgi:nucleoside 2-deoxyribosyltransferase